MDSTTANFRLILALTSLPQDVDLTESTLKVTLAGSTQAVPLTNKESVPLDFTGVQVGAKVEFGLEDIEGFMFGYSELKVPNAAFERNEFEVNDQIRFYLINKIKDSFITSVNAVFINKGINKEMIMATADRPKSAIKKQKSFERQDSSKSPSASPKKRSASKGKSSDIAKATEKNFQTYVTRLVDTQSPRTKNLMEESNSISQLINLNKLHQNLPKNFGEETPVTYSSLKLRNSASTAARLLAEPNVGDSPTTSFYRSAKGAANDDSRTEDRNILIGISPKSETEKKYVKFPSADEIADYEQEDRSPTRSGSNSPLKIRGLLDRKPSPSRREAGDVTFYNAQLNNLNNVIINQTSKIADLEIHQKENEDLRTSMHKSENARKGLQESVLETVNELKKENKELERQVSTVMVEKEGLLKKIVDLQNSVQVLSSVLATTKANLQEKEDINTQNSLRLTELSDLKKQFKRAQDALIASENQKTKDQETYKNSLARFELSLQDTIRTINVLNLEKKKLTTDLCQTQQELALERANHQSTQNELLLTNKRLENAENYKDVVNSLESQRDQLTHQLSDSRTDYSETQQLLQEAIEKLAMRQREFENNERNFNREVGTISEKLAVSEIKNDRLNRELNEQKLKVSQLSTATSSLGQLLAVKEDISKQLEDATKQLVQVVEDRKALRAQLDKVTLSHEQTNAKLFESEKDASQLRQVIEEQNQHIEQLTYAMIALRENQQVYVPAKGDAIDGAMAEYINASHNSRKLKLLILREAEGVYKFGAKRIYVKLEGTKVLIRVGGGFLTMDEFMDQYGEIEIEKMERLDPLKKLTHNIAVSKALVGKCVHQMEKPKNQAYEYRTDGGNMRSMHSPKNLKRMSSRGEF